MSFLHGILERAIYRTKALEARVHSLVSPSKDERARKIATHLLADIDDCYEDRISVAELCRRQKKLFGKAVKLDVLHRVYRLLNPDPAVSGTGKDGDEA